ncbi:hypothetical protein B0H13DRAFT_2352095 [Mycena leptocephala]|nr:hypothetical protein B0H13DRAFT_2352095 [Mycena leptocephala]
MQFNVFVLFSMLYASAQVSAATLGSAQLENWICTCTTNGVEATGISSDCCALVRGDFRVNDCTLFSDVNPSLGTVGNFRDCCAQAGQGSGCTPF